MFLLGDRWAMRHGLVLDFVRHCPLQILLTSGKAHVPWLCLSSLGCGSWWALTECPYDLLGSFAMRVLTLCLLGLKYLLLLTAQLGLEDFFTCVSQELGRSKEKFLFLFFSFFSFLFSPLLPSTPLSSFSLLSSSEFTLLAYLACQNPSLFSSAQPACSSLSSPAWVLFPHNWSGKGEERGKKRPCELPMTQA